MTGTKKDSEKQVSYFFTNFPEDFGAKEMWKVFTKWGEVNEVFIPLKKDRWGKRFGFVLFKKVQDPVNFGSRLDKIIIGNKKLKVNIHRFEIEDRRLESKLQQKEEGRPKTNRNAGQTYRNAGHRSGQESKRRTYAEVVQMVKTKRPGPAFSEAKQGRQEKLDCNLYFNVEPSTIERLNKCYVGKLCVIPQLMVKVLLRTITYNPY